MAINGELIQSGATAVVIKKGQALAYAAGLLIPAPTDTPAGGFAGIAGHSVTQAELDRADGNQMLINFFSHGQCCAVAGDDQIPLTPNKSYVKIGGVIGGLTIATAADVANGLAVGFTMFGGTGTALNEIDVYLT